MDVLGGVMSKTIKNIDNISLIIGNYFILLLLIILILLIAYYFFKRLFIKNKMREISPDDLEIINKFYNNDISYSLSKWIKCNKCHT